MDLKELTEAIVERVGEDTGLDATMKFDMGDYGTVFVDGNTSPMTIDNRTEEADCTITVTSDVMKKLLAGELNPTMAFMGGKFKVAGDVSIALKVSKWLS